MALDARLLTRALAQPPTALALDAAGWTALLAIARAALLLGSLALRLEGLPVPEGVAPILAEARGPDAVVTRPKRGPSCPRTWRA